mgnify:CR=1 FL=1
MKNQAVNEQSGGKTNSAAGFDEMVRPDGSVRPAYQKLADWLSQQSRGLMAKKQEEAEAIFRRLGITFAVYGDSASNERLIPFDLIPRIISAKEWRFLERGIELRCPSQRAGGEERGEFADLHRDLEMLEVILQLLRELARVFRRAGRSALNARRSRRSGRKGAGLSIDVGVGQLVVAIENLERDFARMVASFHDGEPD